MCHTSYDAAFYEAFEEERALLERCLPASFRYFFTWETIQESGHSDPPAPIISTRTQSSIPVDWLSKIRGLITRSTGYDHVCEVFRSSGVRVPAAYLPEYAARAVAEQALLLWTSLLRRYEQQRKSFSTFHRDGLTGAEIRGKTIAILGVGRIGREIAEIAKGLSMNVIGVDPAPAHDFAKTTGFSYLPLEPALERAEIAVCAMSLNRENRGLLNAQKLRRVPRGGIFVNIARGEISPATGLIRLLEEGHLGGVALDVYNWEKQLAGVLRNGTALESVSDPARSEIEAILALSSHPNAVLTPHNAFNTVESVERKSRETAANLAAFLDIGRFLTPVPDDPD
jgi:D-lactate dehydrogenase